MNRFERQQVPHEPLDQGMLDQAGALPDYAIAAIRKDKGIVSEVQETPEVQNPHADILDKRPRITAPKFLADLKVRWGFHEHDGAMQIAHDVIGMVRRRIGGDETYDQKLLAEEEKGHKEAASYGTVHIHGHEAVLSAMHWDFFAGSLGVVVGEKIMKAAQLGTRRELPLITFFTSGGARQQENFPGLVQMARTTHAIESHKKKSKRGSVGVALHQTWGGVSASALPRMHVTAAIRGTDHGFTGPRVIESFTYEPVPAGAQSGEMSVRQRSLDLLIDDAEALDKWLGGFLAMDEAMYKVRGKKPSHTILALPHLAVSQHERFSFEKQGFVLPEFKNSPLTEVKPVVQEHVVFAHKPENTEAEKVQKSLFEQYTTLRSDARRPDFEYILANAFTDVVPLYSKEVKGELIKNPAIGAALGKIGDQPFLIIGNMPSYQQSGDTTYKIPSSPGPEDFLYMQRMLKFGEEVGYPVIFLTDTLGAKPTLDAEHADQSRRISDSIAAGLDYPHPVISVVIGGLGSGGGMATTPMGDHVAMLEGSMAFVAEPVSAASILYNKANPDREEVESTINTMRSTAKDQLELKLIDAVIPEPEGGAEENPLQAVQNLRDHLAQVAYTLLSESQNRRLKRRDKRIEGLRGFTLKGNMPLSSQETVVI